MNLVTRLRVWFRQWRRKRASKRQKAPLREFVYLDEVSVYSLNASRLGSIAAEFTEKQTASLQSEIGGSLDAGASGVVKAGVNSRLTAGQTQESQVVRRSIVQTTFKELYELELDSLAMRPIPEDLEPPKVDSLEDLKAATKTLGTDGWIVDPAKLARGQLLEAEVQLEVEDIFQFNEVVSTVLEIVQDDPEMFGIDLDERFGQVRSINCILEKLLVGLVPIQGYATDYRVVKLGKREWIVHCGLLNQLTSTDSLTIYPLYVVGVAEESLFWKDIRRVLFSGARFRVLCRMAQDGLQESWTPVKLAHVLGPVAPELAAKIDGLGSGALAAMSGPNKPDRSTERKQLLIRDALTAYAMSLADHYDFSLTAQDLPEVDLLSEQHCTSSDSLTGSRKAFSAITSLLHDHFDFPQEPVIAAQYRWDALEEAGLTLSGQVMPPLLPNGTSSPAPSHSGSHCS